MALDNDDIQQLITLLQKLVVNSSDNSTDEPVVKKTRKPKTKNKNTSQPTKKKFINKFNDMPEMNMFKEDVAIDKKLQKAFDSFPKVLKAKEKAAKEKKRIMKNFMSVKNQVYK